jgi:D-alanyl-D-alanine carboxypeptidase (penicillin-binding protein 5/6)
MEPLNEWFSPEQLEEQIDTQLRSGPQLTTNERLLHDLQHVTQEDAQSLEHIRMRLLIHASDNSKRPPVPIQRYQQRRQGQMSPSGQRPIARSGTKHVPRLLQLAMGLVALLVIGSMLGIFMQKKPHQPLQVTTPSPTSAVASSVQIHGKAAFVLDATTGKVLVDANSHAHLQFTGTARLMTAVVAIENSDDLNQQITISQSMLQEKTQGTSSALLQVDDTLTLHDLIYALLLSGGNDAAIVIAHAIAGNTPDFVTQMNNEAHKLQLNDTHFSNPYGTPTKADYSSAADLANLTQYALQRFEFAQAFKAPRYSVAATEYNHAYNWVSSAPTTTSDITGANYGYNASAGASIVFSSHRADNQVLIGAEIGAPSVSVLVADVKLLLKQ